MIFRPLERWERRGAVPRPHSPFKAPYQATIDLLEREARMLGARQVVVELALREADLRLEELTAGEVDTVLDREGRTFLLQRAQHQLRDTEAAKRLAILNALPAQIALLDGQGRIVLVNERWEQATGGGSLRGPDFRIGLNYAQL